MMCLMLLNPRIILLRPVEVYSNLTRHRVPRTRGDVPRIYLVEADNRQVPRGQLHLSDPLAASQLNALSALTGNF